jgi:SPP1 family predicted phage head-tail adaptor
LQIGKLDQRVVLQSLGASSNDFGEVIKSYTTVATVWGHVISQKGSESFEAARTESTRTIKIKIRYRSDVKTDWRIQWMGESYNVTDVDRSLRRQGELWLMCESVVAE